jgi:opacity protein-like surface antigen
MARSHRLIRIVEAKGAMTMRIRTLALGIVGSALVTTSVLAADLPPPPAGAPPPPMAAPAFDWSGPYIGAYGGVFVPGAGQAGIQAGFNVVRGRFLAGLEAQAGAIFGGGGFTYEAYLNGRLGFILGDRFLLYGEAGVGTVGGTFVWAGGGGMEFALRDAWSLFAEAKVIGVFGGGGIAAYTVQGGINWHR